LNNIIGICKFRLTCQETLGSLIGEILDRR
jgi:hypothetical protein